LLAAPRFTGEATDTCPDARNFSLARVRPGETTPVILLRSDIVDPFQDLHADADPVFWKNADGIFRMPSAGGTPEQLLALTLKCSLN
jgi:hypothetical protein